MWVTLNVLGSIVGLYLAVLTVTNMINLLHFFSVRSLWLPPGYEVNGAGSLTYVTGPRDINPVMFGTYDMNDLDLAYHEDGLSIFKRWWTFWMWFRGLCFGILAVSLFALVAWLLLTYCALPYLPFLRSYVGL
jgi:hypothetical protein